MRALWSERPNCSHNVSQKVKRIRCFSDNFYIFGNPGPLQISSVCQAFRLDGIQTNLKQDSDTNSDNIPTTDQVRSYSISDKKSE